MKKFWPTAFSSVVIAVFVISFVPQARPVYASTSGVVISQVYGGGGNSGATYKNDFIELYNNSSADVDISTWSVQYASAAGTSWQVTNLSGTIGAGKYYLVQEAAGSGGTVDLPIPNAIGTILMSATAGKVALVGSQTASTGSCASAGIVDFVGYGTTANCFEGTGPAPAPSNINADLRLNGGATDTDDNKLDFVAGTPNPRNTPPPGPTPPTGVGAAAPNALFTGDSTLLTVKVKPGANPPSTDITVSCDLSGIGRSNPQTFYDDGTNGDATVGDSTFSFLTTVASGVTGGSKSLPCTVADAQTLSSTANISLTVTEIIPIGKVNGVVTDAENATLHRSPYAPATGNGAGTTIVTVQGVIYENTLQATSSGYSNNGFFLQNTAGTADSDPNTSDGLFVYMGSYATLLRADGTKPDYAPQVGDEVVVSGKVSEYYNMTELSSSVRLVKVVQSGLDIEQNVAPVVANPPTGLADANRYWERMQSMRVQVPQGSIVLGGRNVFSPADAEVWVASPDSTVGKRTNLYENRAFRDAHPLDDNYDPNVWDGNGYRILMGSLGIKYAANDAQVLIDPARTFDTVTNAPSGGLNYTFSKYRIEIAGQPIFGEGPDPAQNNPPQAPALHNDYTIVDYNLENLYDFRDNPFSGCDFNDKTTNPKCSKVGTPFIDDVTPASGLVPYNYVPASEEDYLARIHDIALEIINDLHAPDVLMVQEVENQDYCKIVDGGLVCDPATNNADGRPDVLQDLALEITAQGGPTYDSAFDRDSSDLRGIAPAFLFRTDRVELLPAAGDPVLGVADPQIGTYDSVAPDGDISNPKTFNATYTGTGACETNWVFPRAPDVGLFRIHATTAGGNGYRDVYVINNHFKSGPDTCVGHRTEQAKYNAALVQFIQAANPEARIVLGGDLNVYPRPDDIALNATDQLGSLYDPALGLKNLWEVLLAQHPEAAYSYVYLGQAQTLDQMFVNGPMLADLGQFHIAHINSDFPADYPGDVARGTSDHDPNVATFGMFAGFFQPVDNLPELNIAKAGSAVPVKFGLGGDEGLNVFAAGYPKSQVIACPSAPLTDSIEQTVTAGNSSLQYDPLTQTYTYVWKTDKAYAGSCRQLTVQFIDGTLYQANFQFTK